VKTPPGHPAINLQIELKTKKNREKTEK